MKCSIMVAAFVGIAVTAHAGAYTVEASFTLPADTNSVGPYAALPGFDTAFGTLTDVAVDIDGYIQFSVTKFPEPAQPTPEEVTMISSVLVIGPGFSFTTPQISTNVISYNGYSAATTQGIDGNIDTTSYLDGYDTSVIYYEVLGGGFSPQLQSADSDGFGMMNFTLSETFDYAPLGDPPASSQSSDPPSIPEPKPLGLLLLAIAVLATIRRMTGGARLA